MTRLTSDFWVSAYLKRLALLNIPAFLVTKGDATAGAVIIKMNTLDGQAVTYNRSFDLMSDTRSWQVLAEGAEQDVDASLAKQRAYDPDIWVIEVEDREGRHLLDQDGFSD
jgi:hypothetical protein